MNLSAVLNRDDKRDCNAILLFTGTCDGLGARRTGFGCLGSLAARMRGVSLVARARLRTD